MAWFRVDDSFHTSRKVKSIPARQRFAAIGLWTIAGSWVSQELTDGFVPDYMIKEWGATPKVVQALVDSGLWDREHDGFTFRSWSEYNPSKARVERDRAASKARMEASRERRRGKSAGREVASEDVAPQHNRNTPDVLRRPDPTRPDPSLNTYVEREGESAVTGAENPPSKNCGEHPGGTDKPCAGCGKARRAHAEWETAQRRRAAEAKSVAARRAAADRQAEIDMCDLCDEHGYQGVTVCDHNPGQAATAAAGVAKARAALRRTG